MTDRPAEDVWQYPRPPAVEPSDELVVVELGGSEIVRTSRALRVLETSHPPTYYLPLADVAPGVLHPVGGTTWCEWKGSADYFDVVAGGRTVPAGAWTYPSPTPAFAALTGHLALYPGRMDRCTVDGEVVQAQEGDFYGGWITSRVRGPFKGAPGTLGW
ncbi:DUF427 domain-containing protein [Aeromicrobium marinum]|uniref:DUF427 domain-containing protein n=1 Tax=Aeromicrobium marinum TaxID=219314 RepID=UPI001B7FC846|nr:DUF427 domain-containing protein [Aeromicrobium marinum]